MKISKWVHQCKTAAIITAAAVISSQVYANQCAGVFDTPVSSHGRGINLLWGTKIQSEQTELATKRLSQPQWSPACGEQSCQATGSASTSLNLPSFITTSSVLEFRQPFGASNSQVLDFANEFSAINVGAFSTVEVGGNYQFYAIRTLTLEYDSTLILAPGDYWIESLYLAGNARIETKGGRVRLFVRDRLQAQYGASIDAQNQADVLVVSWDDVYLDGANTINASLYSARELNTGFKTQFTGTLAAAEVRLGVASQVTASEFDVELFNGLCSDFGPLPDADADGWPDGIDPDDDNDGTLDSQAGQVEEETGYDYRTVDDGNGNLVDTNQCTDVFAAGLQSHSSDRGSIRFHYGAQLLNSPKLTLPTPRIRQHWWTPEPTCETGTCLASGEAAPKLPSRDWAEFSGREWFRLRYRGSDYLTAESHTNRYRGIRLSPNSELTLDAQGNSFIAGDVQLLYRSTLRLTPGDYWLNSLQLNAGTELVVEGEGTVRLYVKRHLSAFYRAKINASASDDSAAKLLIVTQDDAFIGDRSNVNAWLYSEGRVSVNGDFTGSISAADVHVGPFSTVSYDYPALWQTDFYQHCDIDADGEYDLFDLDRDGDGIGNEYEKALDFDPTDPTSTPPDMDGDHIPDALDDDRDGDGVLNNDDVFPDDSTEWADMDGDGIGDNSDPDRDGDNFTNDDEVAQGTDPNDATDYPDIIDPTASIIELLALTNQATVTVTASAADEYSGLKSVVLSNHTADSSAVMTQQENGQFQATITLVEGKNDLSVTATDNWDNQTTVTGQTNRDSTAPVITITTPQRFDIASHSITLLLDINEQNSGVTQVTAQDNAGNQYIATAVQNLYQVTVPLTEGMNALVFKADDLAGNTGTLVQTVKSDTTGPEFSDLTHASLTNAESTSISVNIGDQLSDIATVSLLVNGVAVDTVVSITGQTATASAEVALQEGKNVFEFTAKDTLENTSRMTGDINRDATAPVLVLALPENTWQAEQVYTLSGTVSDENSGIAGVTLGGTALNLMDGAFNSAQTLNEGLNTFTVVATDNAGNEREASVTVGWDNTDPVLEVDQPLNRVTNLAEWTLTGTVSDAHSGVQSLIVQFADGTSQSVTLSDSAFTTTLTLALGQTEGKLVLTDLVGHSTEQTFTVLLDQTKPTITLSQNGNTITSGSQQFTNIAQQTFDLAIADDSSGLAAIRVSLNAVEQPIELTSKELNLNLVSGDNSLVIELADLAGNQSTLSTTLTLDQQKPDIIWQSTTENTKDLAYTAQWQATDNQGIATQRLIVDGREQAIQATADGEYQASLTLSEGANELTLTVTDVAGNQETLTKTVIGDTTGPAFSDWQVPALTKNAQVDVAVQVADLYSGVAAVSLTVNGSEVSVSTTDVSVFTQATATVTLQEGPNELVFTANDSLGNPSSASTTINLDSTAPILSLTPPDAPWQAVESFIVSGTVSDENSGLASVLLGSQSLTLTEGAFRFEQTLAEGMNTFTVIATDVAGNERQASVNVGLDVSDPVLTVDQNLTVITNRDTWQISGEAADAQSGIRSLQVIFSDGATENIDLAGNRFSHTFALTPGQTSGKLVLTDNVGHYAEQAFTVLLDQTAPTIEVTLKGEKLAEGDQRYTNQAEQQLSLALADDSAGLESVTIRLNGEELAASVTTTALTVTLAEGNNALVITLVDKAGNAQTLAVTLTLDQTKPQITWLSDTDPTREPRYIARWQASDNTGIAQQQLSVAGNTQTVSPVDDYFEATLTLSEGQNVLALTVTDLAGNQTTLSKTLLLDTKGPELTINDLPALTGAESITVTGTVKDGLPVLVVVNGQAATLDEQGAFALTIALSEGVNDINVQATDELGNPAQQTRTLISDRTGPTVSITLPADTEEETITVSGTVTDTYADVATMTVTNLTTGVPYAVTLTEGTFSTSAPVALEPGINELQIIATDSLNNESTTTAQIDYLAARMQWRWLSHAANQQVTDDTIVLEGLLETELQPAEFTVTLGGASVTLTPWETNVYSVKSARLPLVLGSNRFELVATSATATLTDTLTIERIESEEETNGTFELTVNSPASGLQVSGEYLVVSGEVEADATPSVTINGNNVSLLTSLPYYRFSETLAIPQDQPNFTVEILARAADGAESRVSRTVYLDTDKPVITLDNALLDYPQTTRILQNPYTLSGKVSDANFSSLTLNGNLVSVSPVGNNEYTFSAALSLASGVETDVVLIAKDTGGNRTAQNYLLQLDSQIDLSWLLPVANSQLITYGEAFDLQVVVRTSEQSSEHRYQVRLVNDTEQTNGDWQALTLSGGTASTELELPGTAGDFHLEVQVLNAGGERIAALPNRTLIVSAPATVPLALSKASPEQGATQVDPKSDITLFFNQEINPSLLAVNVYETAHGKTWINQDENGTEFYNAQGHQLVDVQRDYEAVPLNWQLISDNKTVLITLGREPAYNATLFVEVRYDDETYARYQYQTQPLPTLVNVVIRDQYSREVPNLTVRLGEQIAVTSDKGFVQFGYNAENPLSSGDYILWVNPGLTNARYGETKLTVAIDGGRLNDLGILPVSYLNPEIGATTLSSGENHSLLGDEVLFDLTKAQVIFPNGGTEGRVHVQFNTQNYNYPTHPFADPAWVFSFQPLGIQLSGEADIALKFPTYQNSRAYLPDNGTLMLLAAVNPTTEQIEPVGLVERQGDYAKVLNPEAIKVLDHIGVIPLPEGFQSTLQEYRNQEISFAVLMVKLVELAKEYEPEQKEATQ